MKIKNIPEAIGNIELSVSKETVDKAKANTTNAIGIAWCFVQPVLYFCFGIGIIYIGLWIIYK